MYNKVHLLTILIYQLLIINCENMMQNKKNIYRLGIPLGLNNKDIDEILKQTMPRNEQTILSAGPDIYCGGWYGTVSIYDF